MGLTATQPEDTRGPETGDTWRPSASRGSALLLCLPSAGWAGEWPPDAVGMGARGAPLVWGTPAWALVCGWVAPGAQPGTQCGRPHPP